MRLNQRNLAYFASCKSPVDKEGSLLRYSESKGTYQNKWFVLKGNILFYFDKNGDKDPQGAIILEGGRIELADTKEGLNAFQISFTGQNLKQYRFVAESHESMVSWMQVLLCATYDYMKAMVEELQREMDKLTSDDSDYSLVSSGEELPQKETPDNSTQRGNVYSSATLAVRKFSHPQPPMKRTPYSMYDLPHERQGNQFQVDNGMKSSSFPNPLYDVLDEVGSPTKEAAPPIVVSATDGQKKNINLIIEREYSESEESSTGSGESPTYVNMQSVNSVDEKDFDISTPPELPKNKNPMSTSLNNIAGYSENKGASLKSTRSNPDLHLSLVDVSVGSKLPTSKSDLQLQDPLYANTERRDKLVVPQKPNRAIRQPMSMLYENVTSFASDFLVRSNSESLRSNINAKLGKLDIPLRPSNIFNRGSSANDLREVETGRSIFHDKEIRSFPEMHAEFGMLVIKKINEFRQRRTHSSVSA